MEKPSLTIRCVLSTIGLLSALGCGSSERAELSSALLITMDTTIPEALSCYGNPKGTTPHLDRLAEESVLYTAARTVTPITAPAHASILTGLYPVRHSVRMNGSMVLPPGATTLAERARERGFATAAVTAAVVLKRDFGLDQGFEEYDDGSDEAGVKRNAELVTDRAIRWLDGRDVDRPFLLWVHYFDPHRPYRAPESFLERVGEDPYLAEVAYMDHHIGRLLERIRTEGIIDEITVVAVADHGEGLGRHGEMTHAAFGFDSTLAVPMLIRHPDGWGAGRRSTEIVSVVDVYSTLIEATGLGSPGDVDGYSLCRREVEDDRGVYFETYFGFLSFGWSQLAGWADAEGKYLFSSRPEFYDMTADRLEQRDRIQEAGDVLESYRRSIEAISDRDRLGPSGLEGHRSDLQEQIEKLGYAGVGSGTFELPLPLDVTDRPSPHDRIRVYQDYLASGTKIKLGDREGALRHMQDVVDADPLNHTAHSKVGGQLMKLGRHREAIPFLKKAIELRDDEWIAPYFKLAECYDAIGEHDEAIDHYQRGLVHGVGPISGRQRLIELLDQAGRHEEANVYRRQALGQPLDDALDHDGS